MSSQDRKAYWRAAKKKSRSKHGAAGFIKEYTYKGIYVTPDQYVAMIDSHQGRCGVCGELFVGTPYLDHDHATGKPRGLLCAGCNTGLGCFRDDPAILERAADYLKRAKK